MTDQSHEPFYPVKVEGGAGIRVQQHFGITVAQYAQIQFICSLIQTHPQWTAKELVEYAVSMSKLLDKTESS